MADPKVQGFDAGSEVEDETPDNPWLQIRNPFSDQSQGYLPPWLGQRMPFQQMVYAPYRAQPGEQRDLQMMLWLAGYYGDDAIAKSDSPMWGRWDARDDEAWKAFMGEVQSYQGIVVDGQGNVSRLDTGNVRTADQIIASRIARTKPLHDMAATGQLSPLSQEVIQPVDQASVEFAARGYAQNILGRDLTGAEAGAIGGQVVAEDTANKMAIAQARTRGEQALWERGQARLNAGMAGDLDLQVITGGQSNDTTALQTGREIANAFGLTEVQGYVPPGSDVYEQIGALREGRGIVLTANDPSQIEALQRWAEQQQGQGKLLQDLVVIKEDGTVAPVAEALARPDPKQAQQQQLANIEAQIENYKQQLIANSDSRVARQLDAYLAATRGGTVENLPDGAGPPANTTTTAPAGAGLGGAVPSVAPDGTTPAGTTPGTEPPTSAGSALGAAARDDRPGRTPAGMTAAGVHIPDVPEPIQALLREREILRVQIEGPGKRTHEFTGDLDLNQARSIEDLRKQFGIGTRTAQEFEVDAPPRWGTVGQKPREGRKTVSTGEGNLLTRAANVAPGSEVLYGNKEQLRGFLEALDKNPDQASEELAKRIASGQVVLSSIDGPADDPTFRKEIQSYLDRWAEGHVGDDHTRTLREAAARTKNDPVYTGLAPGAYDVPMPPKTKIALVFNEGAIKPDISGVGLTSPLGESQRDRFLRAVRREGADPESDDGLGGWGVFGLNKTDYDKLAQTMGVNAKDQAGQEAVARRRADELFRKYGNWQHVAIAWRYGNQAADAFRDFEFAKNVAADKTNPLSIKAQSVYEGFLKNGQIRKQFEQWDDDSHRMLYRMGPNNPNLSGNLAKLGSPYGDGAKAAYAGSAGVTVIAGYDPEARSKALTELQHGTESQAFGALKSMETFTKMMGQAGGGLVDVRENWG